MSKDPAFLFYTSDFLTGTMFMTDQQVGKYIRLLCSQHQHGGMINKDIFEQIVGTDTLIRSKFIECEDGFFNQRLMEEMERRQKKSSNLSDNAKKRWANEKQKLFKSNAIALQKDMPIENESINSNNSNLQEDKDSNGQVEKKELGIEKVREVANEVWGDVAWLEQVCMANSQKKDQVKAWMADFNSSLCNDFIHDFDTGKYKKLFTGWLRKQIGKGNSKPIDTSRKGEFGLRLL